MSGKKNTTKHQKCKIEYCQDFTYAKKLCHRHYTQMRLKGYIYGNPSRKRTDPVEYVEENNHIKIKLFNMNSFLVGFALIDKEDIQRVIPYKWHLTSRGYVESRIKGKLLKLHQLIMDGKYIDHKDRNPLNNRKNNLRFASQSMQCANTIRTDNRTGYKGVTKDKKKYCARISVNNKLYRLGNFDTKEEAAIAYDKAALKYHGEFACLNLK